MIPPSNANVLFVFYDFMEFVVFWVSYESSLCMIEGVMLHNYLSLLYLMMLG